MRALLLVLAFASGASVPAQTPVAAAAPARDGEVSAPGRWYVDGGNVARSGTSANPPLVRRPKVAWRIAVDGAIVGDPLVWDDHVVLALKVNEKRSRIEVRRLADGTVVGQRELDSRTAPWAALWGNEVVWRVGEGGLELLRFDDRKVAFVARTPTKERVGPPLRSGSRVWVVADSHLVCLRAADFRELWRSKHGGYCGAPAAAGGEVYAWRAVGDGKFAVFAHDRRTGEARAQGFAVSLGGAPDENSRITIAGGTLLARVGDGHSLPQLEAKVPLNALQFQLPLREDPAHCAPTSMPVVRALDARYQVGAFGVPGGRQLGLFEQGSDKGIRLDTCEVHRALADVPPTLLRDVVYFGACAVEMGEYRMLWRLQRDGERPLPSARAVPAGRTLLLAGPSEVVALREDAPADPVADELQAAWQAGQRERLMVLADEAVRACDWELALDLLADCRERNVDEAWATKREKDIARQRTDKRKRTDENAAARIRADADAAPARALDDVQASLAGWDARPADERRRGLRFVLQHAPQHAAATAAVRALLPAEVQPTEPFLAEDWLDFLDAVSATEVGWLDPSLDETNGPIDPIVAQSKQQLAQWRSQWRPDLQALTSDRLVLFSPLGQPGSLAKALATGEVVCDLLESMFAHMPVVRQDPRPLLVFIYGDNEEFLAESAKLGIDATHLAGYYSDRINELVSKSRLYVPSSDVGFARVLPTLAHELTHHWLMDRCPAYTPDAAAARFGPKSFWIVEGFASLVEQFEFDVVQRRFALGSGNPEYADMVASAGEKLLIPWPKLVAMRQVDYGRLMADEREIDVPSTRHLGSSFTVRGINLFYAQAAMLSRYLYDAEDGRHRQKLFDFVAAYYTGAVDELDFAKAFGTTAAELGPKVVAYSRSLVQ